MAGFSDLDLGPGGEFVTRWGGDPTKDGAAPATWLVPPTSFFKPDAWTKPKLKPWRPQDSADEHAEFVYVPRATMPLPNDQPDAGSNAPPATMEVALLTLVPRFDVNLENWYFDLEIDAAAAAEPFIRLGLVRYQWNAPAHLRVSEPIVEWAQLLPERKMTVQEPLLIKGEYEVTVVVTGAAGRQRSPSSGNGELQPRMEIESWRYDRNDVPTRRISATADPTDNSSSGTQWDKTLILDEDPTSPPSGARYAITATEHNVMRPATYEMEPFDSIRDPDKTCSSGPRFAARVDLPAPTKAPASTTQETDEPSLLLHEG